jgi:hypothetical protein
MFAGCIVLNAVPVLPAITMAYKAYYCMFKDCAKL